MQWQIRVFLLAIVIISPSIVNAEIKWRNSNPDFDRITQPDKAAHFLGGIWVSTECREFLNNKWWGAACGMGVLTLWEVKDALLPYEDFGAIGGEGFSWNDEIAGAAGVVYSLHLHDEILSMMGYETRYKLDDNPRYGSRPTSEFWPRLLRAGIYTGAFVGGCALYNTIHDGSPFPHRKSCWEAHSGNNSLLETHNSEISFILPWAINGQLRPYFPIGIRFGGMVGSLLLFEAFNGIWDDQDVPWLGDHDGFRIGDLGTGVLSAFGSTIYDIIFHSGELVDEYHSIVPTPEGLSLAIKRSDGFLFVTPQISRSHSDTYAGLMLSITSR